MTTTHRPGVVLPVAIFDDLQPYATSRFHPADGAALLYWLACQASHDPSADDDLVARASISDMVEASGLSSTRLKAYIEALEELEYITYEPLRGTKSRITLLWPALPYDGIEDDEDVEDHEIEDPDEDFDDGVIEADDDALEYLVEEVAELKEHFELERRQTQAEIQRLDDALQQALARLDALAQDPASSPRPVAPPAHTKPSRARRPYVDWSTRESLVLTHLQQLHVENQHQGVPPRELHTRLNESQGWSKPTVNVVVARLVASDKLQAQGNARSRRYIPLLDGQTPDPPTTNTERTHAPPSETQPTQRRKGIDWEAYQKRALELIQELVDESKRKSVKPGDVRNRLKEREGWSTSAINTTLKRLLKSGAIKAKGHTNRRRYTLVSKRTAAAANATSTAKPSPKTTRSRPRVDWAEREAHVLKHLQELARHSDEGVKPGELTEHILEHIPSMTRGHIMSTLKRLLKAGRMLAEGATIHRRYFSTDTHTHGEQVDTQSNASDAGNPDEDVPQPAAANTAATPHPPPDLDDVQDEDEAQTSPEDQDADGQALSLTEEIPTPTTSAPLDINETPGDASQASAQDKPATTPSANAVESEGPGESIEDPSDQGWQDHTEATASETPGQATEDLDEARDQPEEDLSAYEHVIARITRDYTLTSQPNVDASDAAVVDAAPHEAPNLESSLIESVREAYNIMTQGRTRAVIISKLWHEAGEPPAHAFLAWLILEVEAGRVSLSGRGARVHLGDDPSAMLRHQGYDWGLLKFTEPAFLPEDEAPSKSADRPESEEPTDNATAPTSS